MTIQWEVLLPADIDPTGPESLVDIAHSTEMDEYEGPESAVAAGNAETGPRGGSEVDR